MNNSTNKQKITDLPTHLAELRFSQFDTSDPVIGDIVAVQGAMRAKFRKIRHVHDLRMSNLLEAPLANLKASKSHAEKELAATLPLVDAQREKTKRAIASLQKEIDDSLAEGAVNWQFAAETRAHVKGLSAKDREAFVERALSGSDKRVAAAVLGVPGYLSGLNESARNLFLHRYRSECFPESSARTKALNEAQEILDAGGASMMNEVTAMFQKVDISGAEAHADRLRKAEAG